ncbi:MAG: metallophosphoesterase family protein [Thermodesulfobacteriota bacterium]
MLNNKLAVISDIHANYEALEAVLEDIEKVGVSKTVSLGDNIGYGPDPSKVVSTLQLNNIKSVLGNHELAILNPELRKWFNPFAKKALNLTEKMLTENAYNQISEYPETLTENDILFVHGAPPDKVLTYLFEISPDGFSEIFSQYTQRFCFTGHTHQLRLVTWNGFSADIVPSLEEFTYFDPEKRYIINSGSVGQPRDGNKHAKYLIFDPDTMSVELRYIEYDRSSTRAKIIDRGFPDIYAQML